ncbi:MAG: hypothetical protein HY017_01400 [Betaproteobacteria bacterium]|nr:hypothetical protein [Betaproteobacteria bacterium]
MSDEPMRRWIETWKRAGPELEAIRRRELRVLTDEQVCEAALDLLSVPLPADLPPREGSGLVEQQRWFARSRPEK